MGSAEKPLTICKLGRRRKRESEVEKVCLLVGEIEMRKSI